MSEQSKPDIAFSGDPADIASIKYMLAITLAAASPDNQTVLDLLAKVKEGSAGESLNFYSELERYFNS